MKDRILFFILGAVLATTFLFIIDANKETSKRAEQYDKFYDDFSVGNGFFIDKDVLINGTLTITSNNLLVSDEPLSEKKPLDEFVSPRIGANFVHIRAYSSTVIIRLGYQYQESRLSTLDSEISLKLVDGKPLSHIGLVGKRGEDFVSILAHGGLEVW